MHSGPNRCIHFIISVISYHINRASVFQVDHS